MIISSLSKQLMQCLFRDDEQLLAGKDGINCIVECRLGQAFGYGKSSCLTTALVVCSSFGIFTVSTRIASLVITSCDSSSSP